jgi:hypothetical protein
MVEENADEKPFSFYEDNPKQTLQTFEEISDAKGKQTSVPNSRTLKICSSFSQLQTFSKCSNLLSARKFG